MGLDQHYNAQVPLSATFRDENGTAVTIRDMLQGRPIVLLPMFFGCNGVCRLEVEDLFKTLEKDQKLRPGRDFDLVLLSINPTETPELARSKKTQILQAYHVPGGEEGVHGLVGKLDQIRSVTDTIGFRYSYDPQTQIINHPAGLVFLDKNGAVRGYMYGAEYPTDVLAKNVQLASLQQQGVKPEVILLGCVMVDPVTGKKTLVIERLMIVLGCMTVLILGGSILYMTKKYRLPVAQDLPRAGGGAGV
jgi:protein SCO1/2